MKWRSEITKLYFFTELCLYKTQLKEKTLPAQIFDTCFAKAGLVCAKVLTDSHVNFEGGCLVNLEWIVTIISHISQVAECWGGVVQKHVASGIAEAAHWGT